MKFSPLQKFFIRLLIVFLIQLTIKGFDRSFSGFFPLNERAAVFTVVFTSFWLFCWYIISYLNKRIYPGETRIQIGLNILYSLTIGLISNNIYMWGDATIYNNAHLWEEISFINPELTFGLSIIYMMIYMTNLYLRKSINYKEQELQFKELEKEKVLSQYMALKAQIEPHFLFNSLSVLSSIVHTDQNLASDFIIKLSKTLRYIIAQNQHTLVEMSTEMNIVEDYFFLIKTRFNDAVHLQIDLDEPTFKSTYIPPTALQTLIENAIKHNKLSKKQPLKITIGIEGNYIIVSNNLNKKETGEENSTGLGLENIRQRYLLIAQENIHIKETKDTFSILLPILNHSNYERFDH
ncbi:histidine kinase [Flammeovirga sp. SubArs3]|uniref:sensor histidine kinase n=1 Tax=Flammeovirga sp. SubArs3 TaxID=2995316 RepID=UPI00248B26D7|nr:histidine kinase [Flammeovirga sp. SubArs3]